MKKDRKSVARLATQVKKPGVAAPGAARPVEVFSPPAAGGSVAVGLDVSEESVSVGTLNPGRSAAPGLRLDTELNRRVEVLVGGASSQMVWKAEMTVCVLGSPGGAGIGRTGEAHLRNPQEQRSGRKARRS